MRKRTDHLLSVGTLLERSTGLRVETAEIQKWSGKEVRALIDDPFVAESITVMLPVVRAFTRQIKSVEKQVLAEAKLRSDFQLLKTAPGIGDILALTIMYETVTIDRFSKVGNYISYCRCAKSEHTSNNKRKGAGNRKNGNKYLSWAYPRVAHPANGSIPCARLLRPQEEAKPSDGREAGSGRQDRTRLLLRAPRSDAL